MPKKKSTMSHAEAREYWDKHGIDEESPGDEEVEVRTSKNLSRFSPFAWTGSTSID